MQAGWPSLLYLWLSVLNCYNKWSSISYLNVTLPFFLVCLARGNKIFKYWYSFQFKWNSFASDNKKTQKHFLLTKCLYQLNKIMYLICRVKYLFSLNFLEIYFIAFFFFFLLSGFKSNYCNRYYWYIGWLEILWPCCTFRWNDVWTVSVLHLSIHSCIWLMNCDQISMTSRKGFAI